jgi:hypothetical protein
MEKERKTSLSDIFSWIASGAENFKFGVKKNFEAPIWSPSRLQTPVWKTVLKVIGIILLILAVPLIFAVVSFLYVSWKKTC